MIKNDSNFMVNNFLLINVDDDAIYLAKSKQDVLNYWKDHYGTPMELVGETDEEFLDGLRVLDLDSEEVNKIRVSIVEEVTDYTEEIRSYFDVYVYEAQFSGVLCKPILWYDV